jgi:ElaB/YqjD/DUF883 family membrane-anchored ribosome-binding protein
MAAKVAIESTPIASSKVVPLNDHFGHEEQVENSDQGNTATATGRTRKNPMPASDLVKVPTTLSAKEKAAVLEAVQTIHENLLQIADVFKGNNKKGPNSDYNAWNSSIMWLFTNYAIGQMNQNGKIMLSWQNQQQVQNAIVQAAADAEKNNSTDLQNAKNPSIKGVATFGAIGFVLGVLIGVVICLATGGIGAAAAIVPCLIAGAVCGAALGGGVYLGVQGDIKAGKYQNDNDSATQFMTEKGQADQTLLQTVGTLQQLLTNITTTTNNKISNGMQTNVSTVSSQNSALGDQSSRIIQSMGQIMQTPVAH